MILKRFSMKILGIDTSCDDTSIAIIDAKKNGAFFEVGILSNAISSQTEIHRKWGGVYPSLAKRAHQKNAVPVLIKSLNDAKNLVKNKNPLSENQKSWLRKKLDHDPLLAKDLIKFFEKYSKPDINAIAVTQGPGLEPCLWVGINLAAALGYFWNVQIIPVNHVEAHIYSAWLEKENQNFDFFPSIALIVSGGHTQIIYVKGAGEYQIVGDTRDDAAGECFDKTARILGLGYPGGPAIEKIARTCFSKTKIKLPRPMIKSPNYDFSFSGLKTAVFYDFLKKDDKIKKSRDYKNAMAIEIQNAIIDVLAEKTLRAAKNFNVKNIILGGGVSASASLKEKISSLAGAEFKVLYPSPIFSTDNAAMVALAAFLHPRDLPENFFADSNLEI